MANRLEILDILHFLESIENRILNEVIHDDAMRLAVFVECLLQCYVYSRVDLYGSHYIRLRASK